MYAGLQYKVELDLDATATDCVGSPAGKRVVCDIPRDAGAGMKHLTTKW